MDGIDKCQDVPERITGLTKLAYNFWWSWNPEGRLLFKKLSRSAWKLSRHNPVKMLCELDKKILDDAAKDPIFQHLMNIWKIKIVGF
jgi:starch phosphorylase